MNNAPAPSSDAVGRRYLFAGALAVLTAVCHLIYGVWFWTKSPTNAPKTSLHLSGDAYLATYAASGWGTDKEMDASVYNRSAVEILRTGVPRTRSGALFLHAPVYSYFLAGCYAVGGVRLLAVAVPQALLSGLTAFLVALAAYRLAPRHKPVALVAAGLLVLVDIRMAKEVGYMVPVNVLLTLVAGAFLAVANRPLTIGPLLVFVGTLGLGVFTQGAFFMVAGAGALWLGWRWWRQKQIRLLGGSVALVVMVCGKVVLSQLHWGGGADDYLRKTDRGFLWLSNNPCYENMPWWHIWQLRISPEHGWKISADQRARFYQYLDRADGDWRQAARLWIRENPGHYARLCFIRLRTALGPITGHMKLINLVLTTVIWLLVFPAAVYALCRHRSWPVSAWVWLVGLVVLAFSAVVLVDTVLRYRYPLDLLLAGYAALSYAELWGRWRDKRS